MQTNPVQLADDYYLHNFRKLTQHAQTWYTDLLTKEEVLWLENFDLLSGQAQCLLVRMLSRKGELFRSDKLVYAEIPELKASARELERYAFITISPRLKNSELAGSLLSKAETNRLFPEADKSLRKSDLIASLPERDFDISLLPFEVFQLNNAQFIERLTLLFFANTRQDFSQFVVEELGLQRFESYLLSKERRFFHSREEVERLLEINALLHDYQAQTEKCEGVLLTLLEKVSYPVEHKYIERKRQQLINVVARDLERLGCFEPALCWFSQSTLPPSRERRVRMLDKLDQDNEAQSILNEMLDAPFDSEEKEVALRLQDRIRRKSGQRVPRRSKPPYQNMHIELLQGNESVEINALQHFQGEGWNVYYTENCLLNGLFGLSFWEAIFAPVEGAFINAYQHQPVDLYHEDFVSKRTGIIEGILNLLRKGDVGFIRKTFYEKQGIANPFVHWGAWSVELLESILSAFKPELMIALFRVMLSDLRHYRSGMPDLIAFRDEEYLWIEIKGPGDKLQESQWRWIKEFERIGVSYTVCYVTYQT